MKHPAEKPSPEVRQNADARVRRVTRLAVVSATGAAAWVGVVVAREDPGVQTATSTKSTSPGDLAPSRDGSPSNDGTPGSTVSGAGASRTAPTSTVQRPVVTSGGSS